MLASNRSVWYPQPIIIEKIGNTESSNIIYRFIDSDEKKNIIKNNNNLKFNINKLFLELFI